MNLNRVIPWVDMSFGAAVVDHISGGAHKDSPQMHEFAKREIYQKNTDKKQMDIKDAADPFYNMRVKGDQAHGEFFDAHNIHLGKIPHQDPGKGDAKNKKEGKIVRTQ